MPLLIEGGFFMKFFNAEDGYYSLTNMGITLFVVLVAVLLVITAFIRDRKDKEEGGKRLFSTKQLVFCAMALALGFAASYVKVISMPWGGSVTLCSMLFVALVGYWYGPKVGIIAGLAYGILQFVQDGGSYILSPMQACMDYIFAFAALGISGFFYKKKNGLIIGYIAAIMARGVFHTIGGYIYWMDYMPDNFPQSRAIIYTIAYNYAYILVEGIITVIILMLPPVKKAMAQGKKLATE
jgi:thiamine transporter